MTKPIPPQGAPAAADPLADSTLTGAAPTPIIPSKAVTSDAELAILRAELDMTRKQLDATKAQLEAKNAEAEYFVIPNDDGEVPTGRTVSMSICKNPARVNDDPKKKIVDPIWEDVEVPTYMYRIHMPALGGWDIQLDGAPLYEGQVYELDLHTLRTVKSIIGNLWAHEASVHGNDENMYRKPQHKTLSMKSMGAN